MQICKEDNEQYAAATYCPICSYRNENQLLKDNIVELNKEILKLTQQKHE